MGPVNWLAVVLAAALAAAVAIGWGRAFGRASRPSLGRPGRADGPAWLILVVFALASIMMGHNFARLGEAVLEAKPWLYFMQTGGMALFFVIPATWLTHTAKGTEPMQRVTDALGWLAAYLAIGLVFWVLG